jgi:hypothetical protein
MIIASPHRYPDLARLWHRSVTRELIPAFRRAGLDPEVVIFRDGHADEFDPAKFPEATLETARPEARDFIEFYDAMLSRDCEYLFFLDADVFFLDGDWAASYIPRFERPDVAAVSFLDHPRRFGTVYALICRRSAYAELPMPVMACGYEKLEDWPHAIHHDPGDLAAIRLRALGKRIVRIEQGTAAPPPLSGFHGTTNIRASREIFGRVIGDERFEALISEHAYLAKAACDNALLGALYRAIFGENFAVGDDGEHLGGSLTVVALRRVLGGWPELGAHADLRGSLDRSEQAVLRLAARERVALGLPPIRPESWTARAGPA